LDRGRPVERRERKERERGKSEKMRFVRRKDKEIFEFSPLFIPFSHTP